MQKIKHTQKGVGNKATVRIENNLEIIPHKQPLLCCSNATDWDMVLSSNVQNHLYIYFNSGYKLIKHTLLKRPHFCHFAAEKF